MRLLSTGNIKQIGLISLILVVGLSILNQFAAFIPGALAAATLYILMRHLYLKLTVQHKWNKRLAASLFIFAAIVVFVIPVFFLFQTLIPRANNLLSQTDQLKEMLQSLVANLREAGLPFSLNSDQIGEMVQNISSSLPAVLGATANMLTNTMLAFFFLYFMLVQGDRMEHGIKGFLPLKDRNVNDIWESTRLIVYANAIGIPVLAACQGLVAILGYWIFGVKSFLLLGLLTGVFSVVPMVGCALVWVPICVFLGSTGHASAAIGLAIYSFVITGGIDNVLRFTILKRLGDVHPIITTIGIIVGVPMFGFMGFIFGPLLVSYLLLLIKIYRIEFIRDVDVSDSTRVI